MLVLLRVFGLFGHAQMSVALENPEFFAQSIQHQTTVYFSASKTIQFRQDSLNEFAKKLRETYDSLPECGREPAPQVPPDAPRVFLSYASEDQVVVDQLAEKLARGEITQEVYLQVISSLKNSSGTEGVYSYQ